jgi:hypothetical protein
VNGVRDYDLHPPGDLRLFTHPGPGVLRFDDEVLVSEARHGDVVLRHYAFRDRWFKVNCTTDLSGAFVETSTPEGRPFAFNCDVATPMLRARDSVFAVDLFVDVLVHADGLTHRVSDEDELREALARGWISEREADGAGNGLAQLIQLIARGALVPFLSRVHPFGPSSAPDALPMRRPPLTEAPVLEPRARPTWD